MKRLLRLVVLDIKEMSVAFALPLIVAILFTVYVIMIYDPMLPYLALNIYQYLLTPFASWWVIMMFYPLAGREEGEVFFSYGYSRVALGMGRAGLFTLLFTFIILIVCAVLRISGVLLGSDTIDFFAILSVQSFFYAGAGFVLILLIRNTFWTIVSILFLVYLNVWNWMPAISKYLCVMIQFDTDIDPVHIWTELASAIIRGVILFYAGQMMLNKFKFKPGRS